MLLILQFQTGSRHSTCIQGYHRMRSQQTYKESA